MTMKLVRRSLVATVFLGSAYVASMTIGPAGGTSDTTDDPDIVVSARGAIAAPQPLELSPIEVTAIAPVSLVERVRFSGEIRPLNQATLRARSGGRIVQADVREGQSVRAGSVLLRFEAEDFHAVLKQKNAEREAATAELVLAMQSLDRIDKLAGKNIVSQEQLDKAKSEVNAATARIDSLSAQVEMARIALRDAEVIAPFDGIVSKLHADHGARVAQDAELLTVVDVSVMEARVLVSTRDVVHVAEGQRVDLNIEGIEGRLVKGEVTRVNPVTDDGSRSIAVYVRVIGDNPGLKGGMFVTGTILAREQKDAVTVPVAALRRDRRGAYVLKLADNILVRQSVTVIANWNDDEIAQIVGLSPGDLVVTAPLRDLQPNTAVKMTRAS